MSRRAEFDQGYQLQMFMTPDELIDQTNKWDTQLRSRSPREQWEHPKSGVASVHGEEPFVRDRSLREEKLDTLQRSLRKKEFDRPYETMPPVEITHGWHGYKGPVLSQGHHRLAYAEAKKIPYLAVTHHDVR